MATPDRPRERMAARTFDATVAARSWWSVVVVMW
jgi:hypothetical protein